MQIILVGFMGVGKTTVGQLLATALAQPFIDLDNEFNTVTGYTPGAYMRQFSEDQFRQVEQEILKTQLQQSQAVISSGGGVLTLPTSRTIMQASDFYVVYLASDFAVNIERLKGDSHSRPLMTKLTAQGLHELWQMRQAHYQTVANLTINTNGLTPTAIVAQIISKLDEEHIHG